MSDKIYTAFAGLQKVAEGGLLEVALRAKKYLIKHPQASLLVFDNTTSAQIEIDFRGTPENVVNRLQEQISEPIAKPSGPGRPRLGVISREIGLLPRHWDWLSLQPGGASVTLRKLVEESKKKNQSQDQGRLAQDSTYKFMSALAGDLPFYEEALRALFAREKKAFRFLTSSWPKDIQVHLAKLSQNVF